MTLKESQLPEVELESPSSPIVIIRPHTPEEEFKRLWDVLNEVPFYKEKGYTRALEPLYAPTTHPLIKDLAGRSPNIFENDRLKLKEIFSAEIYDPRFYDYGLAL